MCTVLPSAEVETISGKIHLCLGGNIWGGGILAKLVCLWGAALASMYITSGIIDLGA